MGGGEICRPHAMTSLRESVERNAGCQCLEELGCAKRCYELGLAWLSLADRKSVCLTSMSGLFLRELAILGKTWEPGDRVTRLGFASEDS